MKIKNRILLFVFFAVLSTFLSVSALFFIFAFNTFDAVEDDVSIQVEKLIWFAINDELRFLERVTLDWAVWDSMYDFTLNYSDDFISDNFDKSAFESLEINSIFVIDDNYEIYFDKHYDFVLGEDAELSLSEKEIILNRISNNFNGASAISGMSVIGGELYFFSAHKIGLMDGSFEGDFYLIFSKRAADLIIEQIDDYVVYDYITFTNLTLINNSFSDNDLIKLSSKVYRKNVDLKSFKLFIVLENYVGDSIALAEFNVARVALISAFKIFFYLLFLQIFVISLVGGGFYFFMNKYLIKKIVDKNNTIKELIKNEDLAKMLSSDSDLELNELSESFNTLLAKLKNNKRVLLLKNNELYSKNLELKKLDDLKNEFLSKISHELKTPLTAIKSFGQLLDDEVVGKLNDEQKETLKVIIDATSELQVLIDDLFDLSCFEKKKLSLQKSNCSLKDMVKGSFIEFKSQLDSIGAKVDISLPKRDILIYVDDKRFKQVIKNLIANSIKYRAPSRPLEIKLSVGFDKSHIKLSFKDNGIGISSNNLNKLFKKFYQVNQNPNAKKEGVGLGLAIVREILILHKGKISVKSKLGRSTTFFITLPLK
ncbi:MAG: ATP-binding protein [Candidatus Woesearchaeota archaeon]